MGDCRIDRIKWAIRVFELPLLKKFNPLYDNHQTIRQTIGLNTAMDTYTVYELYTANSKKVVF